MSAHAEPAAAAPGGDTSEKSLNKMRSTVRNVVIGVIAVPVILVGIVLLVGAILSAATWSNSGSSSHTYAVASPDDGSFGCDGKMHTFQIGPSDELINGGIKCTMVNWIIVSGPVVIVDKNGTDHTFDTQESFSFTAKRWRAANGSASVAAAFCPSTTTWNGSDTCI